ncbi:MAG TPA: NADP-dependent succinate-semialdehyde dehydrogenase, partial [Verrucomicrobiae bacterium]|nr:NADP-dependent succinate-semialdehyde dehydrogenase [Verrucomicrobiae bacterium]
MQQAAKKTSAPVLPLKDPSLFRQQCYINGKWVDADSGKTIEVNNPATGEILGTVPSLGAAETRRAIEAANAAWPAWRKKTAKERANILRKWFNLMMENQDDLGMLMTAEQGKPLAEAKGEIAYGASFVEWFAEEAKRVYGDTIPQHQADKRIVVIKEPIGVVAAITPWNFPNAMITRKCAPALAAGCPVVIKPASQTPFSATALAELAHRAGIPAGVLNVVTGSATAIGGEMTANPIVRKLSFTGSTEIGKLLMQQCAGTVKKVSLELGGNAPFIVFNDADLGAAVEGAIASKYRNTGQTCVCANRLLVQDGVYDKFAEMLTVAVGKLKVGDGLKGETSQGPLIDMKAVAKVEEHIADAVKKGAKVIAGGKRHELGGSFFQPTVLANVNTQMAVAREETFGPVAPLFRFTTDEEAVQMANDTEFGLAAYFFSRDLGRVWRTAEQLEYGIVGINTGIISTEVAPFGGV